MLRQLKYNWELRLLHNKRGIMFGEDYRAYLMMMFWGECTDDILCC